jgi:pimeloyl-ACP methyl ester carboxylesterase
MYSQMTITDGPIHTRQVRWSWQGQDVTLGVDEAGDGPAILLLPALSSISTRREMHPLMRRLADRAHLVATDWPGFGDQPRPPIAWTPDALSLFLEWFVRQEVPALHVTVASGHAATYALDLAACRTTLLGRLVLLAPTWRGRCQRWRAETGDGSAGSVAWWECPRWDPRFTG